MLTILDSSTFLKFLFYRLVPYQDNSWDCGVFVCRYAFALYQKRLSHITRGDTKNNFNDFITMSEHFDFNMENIAKWRKEMEELLTILIKIYESKKEKGKKKKRKKKG